MIIVNTLRVSADGTVINIDVSTNIGNVFSELKIWVTNDYTNSASAIDLSSLLIATSEREIINVPLSALNIDEFEGLYFLYFNTSGPAQDSDCIGCEGRNLTTIILAPKSYEECLLAGTIQFIETGKKELNLSLLNTSVLLDSLKIAVKNNWLQEAVSFSLLLDDYCEACVDCPRLATKDIHTLSNSTLNSRFKLL